jgi:hypothetical protein
MPKIPERGAWPANGESPNCARNCWQSALQCRGLIFDPALDVGPVGNVLTINGVHDEEISGRLRARHVAHLLCGPPREAISLYTRRRRSDPLRQVRNVSRSGDLVGSIFGLDVAEVGLYDLGGKLPNEWFG